MTRTTIEWTDVTWNPLRGCTRVSQGCVNCYAEGIAARFSGPGLPYEGLAERTSKGPRWTGKVALAENLLDAPLRWRKPRRVFVNSMSDLFHESVPDEWIDRIFAVMALAPQHTFQVLTKRPERMRAWFEGTRGGTARQFAVLCAADMMSDSTITGKWPLPNIWLGTSVEDQATADTRIPHLLDTPAAVRFLSCEPLLGPVDLMDARDGMFDYLRGFDASGGGGRGKHFAPIDWVICGGESGPNARPMHPDWARSLRDQCQSAGVPFFFKQWGEWFPVCQMGETDCLYYPAPDDDPDVSRRCRVDSACLHIDGELVPLGTVHGYHTIRENAFAGPKPMTMFRVGKRAACRLLDGREWNEMPGVAA